MTNDPLPRILELALNIKDEYQWLHNKYMDLLKQHDDLQTTYNVLKEDYVRLKRLNEENNK